MTADLLAIVVPLRTGRAALCPRDSAPLDGGPVAYWCPVCGRGVMAADARNGAAS
jgi:hypothetical protein